ncbi:magnesium transporter [Glutamicibacter endophyticus]
MTQEVMVDFSPIESLLDAELDAAALRELANRLAPLSAYAVRELIRRLPSERAAIVFRLLDRARAVELFEHLEPALRADLFQGLQDSDVAAVFAALDVEERVALLDELPAGIAARLLQGLGESERAKTKVLLGYEPGVVGHMMSPNFVVTHPWLSVAETMERVRAGLDTAESVYTLVVTDEQRRIAGVVSLRELLGAAESTLISELLTEAYAVQASEPADDAARRTVEQKMLLVPVLDTQQRVVGVLSLDDAVALREQSEAQRTARGSGSEPLRRAYLNTPVRALVRSRIVWLFVLAIGATLTVQVLSGFEQVLQSMVVLSLFVPLLVGIGGNTGNQAATTVTRALAMGDVRVRDVVKVLVREALVGLSLGTVLGTVGCLLTGVLFGWSIGAVIGLTLLALCTLAASVGGVMPMIGKALKVDPAVFSNPFISTLVDAMGLLIYLGIATLVLGV